MMDRKVVLPQSWRSFVVALILFNIAVGNLRGQSTPFSPGIERSSSPVNQIGKGHVDLEFCRVMLISEVDVPAQESGPLSSVNVREGQSIATDDLLAQIDDRLARLQLETARTKLDAASQEANDDVEVRAAKNALELAEKEQRRNLELYNKRTLPKADYERSVLEVKQAALSLEKAQRDVQSAAKDAQIESYNVKAASQSIERHQIKAPIDGVVMEIYKQPGEWVNAGDDVVRVARMDRMYVQGFLDSSLFNPHEIEGRPASVSVSVARGETLQFKGRIVFVALEKHNAKSFAVRAEVENRQHQGRWLLMANEDEATMRIHLDQETVGQSDIGFQPR